VRAVDLTRGTLTSGGNSSNRQHSPNVNREISTPFVRNGVVNEGPRSRNDIDVGGIITRRQTHFTIDPPTRTVAGLTRRSDRPIFDRRHLGRHHCHALRFTTPIERI